MHWLTFILAVVWTLPALLRTWRMARFYQIEEYKTNRFLPWLVGRRDRWFPRPRAAVMLAAIVLSGAFQVIGLERPIIHFGMWLIVAVILSQPEPVKETKKPFVRTERATRLLGASMLVDAVFVIGLSATTIQTNNPASLSTVAIIGFLAFLLSPLALPLGNALMFPVEAYVRHRFRTQAAAKLAATGATIIGITGSYGKTSTKTYLAHILEGQYKVYPTPKSYNTIMGITLAINTDMPEQLDYFIVEMGAYVPGEIAGICRLTKPSISLVTAVGPMHLERFKTIENVQKAKYEIIEGLPLEGTAIFNADDPHVRTMSEREYPQTRLLISQQGREDAHLAAENIRQSFDGLRFDVVVPETGERAEFQTSLLGQHNITNILMAAAAAHHEGMSLDAIAERVKGLTPAEHRLNITRHPNGITVIDDAYSANPIGAVSALEVLGLSQEGRRIVITPGMIELGELQETENKKLGKTLTSYATNIILVGIEQTQPLQEGIAETDFPSEHLIIYDTFDEAREWFQHEVRPGDTVLFLNDLPDTYL